MAQCSFFADTFAAPRGASWPFFLAFPRFSSSSALFALHPSGFVTSHEQGFLFCTPFAHPISDELFNNLVAQFVGLAERSCSCCSLPLRPCWVPARVPGPQRLNVLASRPLTGRGSERSACRTAYGRPSSTSRRAYCQLALCE